MEQLLLGHDPQRVAITKGHDRHHRIRVGGMVGRDDRSSLRDALTSNGTHGMKNAEEKGDRPEHNMVESIRPLLTQRFVFHFLVIFHWEFPPGSY